MIYVYHEFLRFLKLLQETRKVTERYFGNIYIYFFREKLAIFCYYTIKILLSVLKNNSKRLALNPRADKSMYTFTKIRQYKYRINNKYRICA